MLGCNAVIGLSKCRSFCLGFSDVTWYYCCKLASPVNHKSQELLCPLFCATHCSCSLLYHRGKIDKWGYTFALKPRLIVIVWLITYLLSFQLWFVIASLQISTWTSPALCMLFCFSTPEDKLFRQASIQTMSNFKVLVNLKW